MNQYIVDLDWCQECERYLPDIIQVLCENGWGNFCQECFDSVGEDE